MNVDTLFDGEDYSFNIIKENKGDSVERHLHHNWDETWYILKGSYRFWIDKELKEVSVGDCLTAKRGQTHSVLCMEDGSERIAIFRKDVEIYNVYEH